MLMLAVQINQHFPQFTQTLNGGGFAIDEGLGRTASTDGATYNALPGACQFPFLEPAFCFRGIVGTEGDTDFRLVGTMANHAGVRPVAKCQVEGIKQDGFAGTGFTGQDGQTGFQFQIQAFNDGKVPDMDMSQHRRY